MQKKFNRVEFFYFLLDLPSGLQFGDVLLENYAIMIDKSGIFLLQMHNKVFLENRFHFATGSLSDV